MIKQLFLLAMLYCSGIIYAQTLENYQSQDIDSTLTKKANSIIRFQETKVEILSIDKMLITEKKLITVLNSEGERQASLNAFYSPERTIKKLQATIFDKNGREIKKIKERDFYDYSSNSKLTVITDYRSKTYKYQSGYFPYTIEFLKVYESSNTGFLPKFNFLTRYKQSVEFAKFKLVNTTDIPIRLKTSKLKEFGIEQKIVPGKTYEFVANKISAIGYESQSPSFSDTFPSAKFSLNEFSLSRVQGTMKDWESFGKWKYEKLIKGRDELPQTTIDEVTELTKNATTNLEKAKLVYKYVQDKTRYVSIQLGIGGWQPIMAKEVDRLGYGDCKALTNYTKALMDSQDIPCNYTVVYSGEKKVDFPTDFSVLMGNHVILNLPTENKDVWLECTSQTNPFGYIAGFTDDRNVLVMSVDGGKIKRTTKYTAEDNLEATVVDMEFTEQNELTGRFTKKSYGYNYRNHLKPKNASNKKGYYQKKLKHLNNLDLSKINIKTDTDSIIGTESFNFTLKAYASKAGSRFILIPNVFNTAYKKSFNNKRTLPIEIQRGYTEKDSYTIKYPEKMEFSSLPIQKNVTSPFGEYNLSITKSVNSKLKIVRFLQVNEIKAPPSEFKAYCDFFNEIAKIDRTQLILKPL